jgi:hypothetical protein
MKSVEDLARSYGVRIEYADLGSWGAHDLHSEYDPESRVIRVNKRSLEHLSAEQAAEFAALAIGHELYHHRERIGEVVRLPDRASRESAADAFAQSLL